MRFELLLTAYNRLMVKVCYALVMTVLTATTIGEYLQGVREKRGHSLNDVAAAGGPYRQAQASIENGSADDGDLNRHLPDYDRAYNWPPGMAFALHRHLAADTDVPREITYAGHYQASAALPNPEVALRQSILGFNIEPGPKFGEACYLEYDETVLTNVHQDHLAPLTKARNGVTLLDAALADTTYTYSNGEVENVNLNQIASDIIYNHPAGEDPFIKHQIGTTLGHHTFGDAITVDPTAGLYSSHGARALAGALIAAHPELPHLTEPGAAERIAYTLLGIAAYGGGLRTLTDLALTNPIHLAPQSAPGMSLQPRPAAKFLDYWANTFYDPDTAGPELAAPDPTVCSLLAGLLTARTCNTSWDLSGNHRPAPSPRYTAPPNRDIDDIHDDPRPTLITYDARISPELPAVLTGGAPRSVLHFYAAGPTHKLTPAHALAQRLGTSIGLTDADDTAILAVRSATVRTLTHWIGSTAIYTPRRGEPHRLYLPAQ